MNRFGDIDCSFKRLPAICGYRSAKLVSLEESLQPIQLHIHQLPFYVKTAKKRCHFPSEHGLTRDESASIYIYTMEWGETSLYRVLNKVLRDENRNALTIWFSYLKLFDSALDKLPTVRENVWRGVANDIGKNFSKNQQLTWWSVNSCSSSVHVIKDFLGNETNSTIFLIETSSGKKISGYTEQEQEDEIILKMGIDFRVQGNVLEHTKGSFVVHLVEINDEKDQQHTLTYAMNNLLMKTIPKERKFKFNKWKQHATIVAGGNEDGGELNQLWSPEGIYIDKNQNISIADMGNDRIILWDSNGKKGKIVAGGNGKGERIDQLDGPINVICDEQNNSLIIADQGNRRVIRWLNRNQQEIIIENISCHGLTKDKFGLLYICDEQKNEVRRWTIGGKEGQLVAGGNGKGDQLNQFNGPTFIFIDDEQSIYVSDCLNERVMKWRKDAKEGIVVAGGNDQGDNLNQLSCPYGIVVDHFGQIYVADCNNNRIMRWCEGKEEGEIVVGGNGEGEELNELNCPSGLSFDVEGNLYVADCWNHRIARFDLILE